jgi:hypothetical protein
VPSSASIVQRKPPLAIPDRPGVQMQMQATSQMPQAKCHKPQATGHRPQATGHRPQATGHRPHCNTHEDDSSDFFVLTAPCPIHNAHCTHNAQYATTLYATRPCAMCHVDNWRMMMVVFCYLYRYCKCELRCIMPLYIPLLPLPSILYLHPQSQSQLAIAIVVHVQVCVYGLSCCLFGHVIDTACYY